MALHLLPADVEGSGAADNALDSVLAFAPAPLVTVVAVRDRHYEGSVLSR
jgi:hypothetical protein